MRRKPLTVGFPDLDRDGRRKNASEKGMQRAATVGMVCALIAVMVRACIAVVIMRMLVIGVEGDSSCEGFGADLRWRDNARELGENESGHQHMDKPADRPQPLHQRPLATQFVRIGVGSQCPCDIAFGSITSLGRYRLLSVYPP